MARQTPMIDTHCHLTYDGLHERIDDVIASAAQAGVDRMISVGTTPADAEKARALSQRKSNIYFTAGLHPHYAEGYTDKAALLDALRDKLADEKCVALGEMGLDRHYPDPPFDLQQRVFGWQLELATDGTHAGPIVIHNREATDETLAILNNSAIDPSRFVFHCFTGSAHELDQILAFGAMVSLTGIVTFGSAKDLAQATDAIPLSRLRPGLGGIECQQSSEPMPAAGEENSGRQHMEHDLLSQQPAAHAASHERSLHCCLPRSHANAHAACSERSVPSEGVCYLLQ